MYLNVFKLFDHFFNKKLRSEFDFIIIDTPPQKSSVLTLTFNPSKGKAKKDYSGFVLDN